MAKPGEVIAHSGMGETIRFIETAETTRGDRLVFESSMMPDHRVAAAHVHPNQSERFTLLAGVVDLRIGGRACCLRDGQSVVVPAGTPHEWRNGGDQTCRLTIEFRPALRIEEFFREFFSLAQAGRTDPATGLPDLLTMALVLRRHRAHIQLARPPAWVQTMIFAPMAPVARALGKDPRRLLDNRR